MWGKLINVSGCSDLIDEIRSLGWILRRCVVILAVDVGTDTSGVARVDLMICFFGYVSRDVLMCSLFGCALLIAFKGIGLDFSFASCRLL